MAKRKITNEEEALEAVRYPNTILFLVPEKLRTVEVCLEAVKQNGFALKRVPEKLRTASPNEFGAICLEAVK